MTGGKNRTDNAILRLVRLGSVVALSAGLVAGCSGYTNLGQDPLDNEYTIDGIRWTSGETTLIFMKASNNDGKLSVCSAYTASKYANLSGEAVRQFIGTASMYIGEERIGPMSFANEISFPGANFGKLGERTIVTESSEVANCVRTGKNWNDSYSKELIKFQGPSRIRVEM